MAVLNRNTQVLKGVSVVRGVMPGTVGLGFDSASGKIAAMPFSVRPPSHTFPQAGQGRYLRPGRAVRRSADAAAKRAGRPEASGIFAGRRLAFSAATEEACAAAAWRFACRLLAERSRQGHGGVRF